MGMRARVNLIWRWVPLRRDKHLIKACQPVFCSVQAFITPPCHHPHSFVKVSLPSSLLPSLQSPTRSFTNRNRCNCSELSSILSMGLIQTPMGTHPSQWLQDEWKLWLSSKWHFCPVDCTTHTGNTHNLPPPTCGEQELQNTRTPDKILDCIFNGFIGCYLHGVYSNLCPVFNYDVCCPEPFRVRVV